MRADEVVRVQGNAAFRLHWSIDDWKTAHDTPSIRNSLQIDFVDLEGIVTAAGMQVCFTFFWTDSEHWEGRNFQIAVQ
jgi:glucoamylase